MVDAGEIKVRIQLIRDLSNELAAFFYSLPDNVWRDPEQFGSPCQEWMVADVVTHLIQVGDMFFQSVTRALDGDTKPPGHTGGATVKPTSPGPIDRQP